MNTIPRPEANEYFEYYHKYVQMVPEGNLLEQLQKIHGATRNLILSLTEEKLNYRYEPGKWSIKEIMIHLADAERVFAYRALRFARKDPTDLAGFDENTYVPASKAAGRNITDIMREFETVREATIELLKSFDEEMLMRKGTANKREITVRALAYVLAGHELHHVNIIKERYLK